jgi:hypothetical protein
MITLFPKKLRSYVKHNTQAVLAVSFMVLFAAVGTILLLVSRAASPYASMESVNGTPGTGASLVQDSTASGGKAAKFGGGFNPGMTLRGATIPAFSQDVYASSDFAAEVAELPPDGINTVVLEPILYATSATNPTFPGNSQTATDASIVTAINVVHAAGMKAVLKVGISFLDGTNPGDYAPADNGAAYFANVTPILLDYASLAQANGVYMFVPTGEMNGLAANNPAAWRTLIAKIRTKFSGPVTYNATIWDYNTISWWDAVDYISVDAYFDLVPASQANTSNTNVTQLTAAWTPIMASLQALSSKFNKQVLFTEIGYRSVIGTAYQPWNFNNTNGTSDADQAAAFQSALNALSNKSWFAGMYIWAWDNIGETQAQQANDYTPHLKSAEQVIRQAWNGN